MTIQTVCACTDKGTMYLYSAYCHNKPTKRSDVGHTVWEAIDAKHLPSRSGGLSEGATAAHSNTTLTTALYSSIDPDQRSRPTF